tara:strand:+ start:131 stop:340 length:210 start_codon:yes stop_codon:yes gene_type:complete
MTKQQISELQAQVKKLESMIEVLVIKERDNQADISKLIERMLKAEFELTYHRDSLDRVADLLKVPRSRI